jgi:hypothetical protein
MPAPITPTIPASRPTVQPAVEEKVFDQWKMSGQHIDGTGVAGDTAAGYIRFRKCRTLPDGSIELGPIDDVVTVPLEDVVGLAALYEEVRLAVEANFNAGKKVGTEKGLF